MIKVTRHDVTRTARLESRHRTRLTSETEVRPAPRPGAGSDLHPTEKRASEVATCDARLRRTRGARHGHRYPRRVTTRVHIRASVFARLARLHAARPGPRARPFLATHWAALLPRVLASHSPRDQTSLSFRGVDPKPSVRGRGGRRGSTAQHSTRTRHSLLHSCQSFLRVPSEFHATSNGGSIATFCDE